MAFTSSMGSDFAVPTAQSILDLILRSALLRASRRMATGTAEQAAILRDAPQRCGAPQDEVGIISHALNSRRGATRRRDRYVPRKSRHRAPAHGRNGRRRWFAHRSAG